MRVMMQRPSFENTLLKDFASNFFMEGTFKLDVKKTDEGYLVHAELPGFKKEDIKISYEKEILTISASHEETEESSEFLVKERTRRSMKRTMMIPDVDETLIKAHLENGVLEITLPKTEKAKEVIIDIE